MLVTLISRIMYLSLFLFLIAFSSFLLATTTAQDYDALTNIQLGMQGLMQAGSDPALLAQLMQDMQDPELMAEARKMMEDPEFKKKMKELTGKSEFKESVKKTKEMLEDPNKAAEAEAKFEHMQRVGNDQLKQNAASDMQKAMEALANPEVMEEMMKMLKDPKFKETFAQVSKNPQFKNYIDAMKEMQKDPTVRKKFEAATEAVKAQL